MLRQVEQKSTKYRILRVYSGVINSFTNDIKCKIDSAAGKAIYSMRLAIAEPPFAHIRSVMKLDRFTLRLRTKKKVDIQWKLFCIVHNLKKIHRYGIGYG